MDDIAVSIPDIRALVAERQRFDDWLTALEARRAETPERVFARVHGDYLARRDAVVDKLHTHVGSLETMERDLNERLQQLEEQLAEREDERSEGMLRMAVGEYDADGWETKRREVEESLTKLGADRESLLVEAEDVRTLLTSARHKPHVEPEVLAEPEIVPVEDTQQELMSSNVASAIAHADPAAVEHLIDLNEQGDVTASHAADAASDLITTDPFLRAVPRATQPQPVDDIESAFAVSDDEFAKLTGAHDVPASTDASATPVASSHQGNDRDREADDAIDALGMSAATTNDSLDDIDVFGVSKTAHGNGNVNGSTTSPFAPPPASSGYKTPLASPPPARDAFDDLAFLRSITDAGSGSPTGGTPKPTGSEPAKTLRCTECGTMNFPTEWYCERCGGELAAF